MRTLAPIARWPLETMRARRDLHVCVVEETHVPSGLPRRAAAAIAQWRTVRIMRNRSGAVRGHATGARLQFATGSPLHTADIDGKQGVRLPG